jgi:hypothetical protein
MVLAKFAQLRTWTFPSSLYAVAARPGSRAIGFSRSTGTGTFFEGAMTIGNPTDAIDDAVQANIVATGYRR